MAVKSLVVGQTGSAVQIAAAQTFARWLVFANTAAAAMAVADASVSLTRGVPLSPSTGTRTAPPLADVSQHYDLGQFYSIGTNGQNLTVVYDAML